MADYYDDDKKQTLVNLIKIEPESRAPKLIINFINRKEEDFKIDIEAPETISYNELIEGFYDGICVNPNPEVLFFVNFGDGNKEQQLDKANYDKSLKELNFVSQKTYVFFFDFQNYIIDNLLMLKNKFEMTHKGEEHFNYTPLFIDYDDEDEYLDPLCNLPNKKYDYSNEDTDYLPIILINKNYYDNSMNILDKYYKYKKYKEVAALKKLIFSTEKVENSHKLKSSVKSSCIILETIYSDKYGKYSKEEIDEIKNNLKKSEIFKNNFLLNLEKWVRIVYHLLSDQLYFQQGIKIVYLCCNNCKLPILCNKKIDEDEEEDIEKENENVDRQIYIGGGGGAGGSGGINYDYVASYLTNQQKKIDEKIEKIKQKIKKRNYYIRKVYLEKLAKTLKDQLCIANVLFKTINLNYSNKKKIYIQANVIYFEDSKNRDKADIINDKAYIESFVSGAFIVIYNLEDFITICEELKNTKVSEKFELIVSGEKCDQVLNTINKKSFEMFSNIYLFAPQNEQKCFKVREDYKRLVKDIFVRIQNLISKLQENNKKYTPVFKKTNLINYESYLNKYYEFHEKLSKYYGMISNDTFEIAKGLLYEYIESKKNDLNIKVKSQKASENEKAEELKKLCNLFQKLENQSLETYSGTLISTYTKEYNSFYQDFNKWLRDVEDTAYDKVGYFVSCLMFCLNEYDKNIKKSNNDYNTNINNENNENNENEQPIQPVQQPKMPKLISFKENRQLYRGVKMNIIDLISYKNNENGIICFPSFTSTSVNRSVAENFSQRKNKELRKKDNYFSVVFTINNKYESSYVTSCFDISGFSKLNEEERVFLPYSFYKVKKVIENYNENIAEIELETIGRKEILEYYVQKKLRIKYSEKEDIMVVSRSIQNKKIEKITKEICYNNDSDNEVRIFGKEFVDNNKENCKIFYKDKFIELTEFLKFDKKGENIITLIEEKTIKNYCNMFDSCNNLVTMKSCKNWNMSNAENLNYMFRNCEKLADLTGVENWDISNVKEMNFTFYNCNSLTDLSPLKNWNVIKVTTMKYLFTKCKNITTTKPLIKWNMSKVKNLKNMFENCNNLTDLVGLKNWDLKSAETIEYMFYKCYNIETVDPLKNWNTSHIKNMLCVFAECEKIDRLTAIGDWDTSEVEYMNNMFYMCKNIYSADDLKFWDLAKIKSIRDVFDYTSIDKKKNPNAIPNSFKDAFDASNSNSNKK